ncbi:MAG: response regulator [Nannocystaceae bacterium]
MRIIHLEDDEIIAEFVQILCDGHDYTWARRSDEAVALAMRQSFDLAFIDLGLRGGDTGLHFMRWLAEHDSRTYRVLMSGVATHEVSELFDMADATLDKPFTARGFAQSLVDACARIDSASGRKRPDSPPGPGNIR